MQTKAWEGPAPVAEPAKTASTPSHTPPSAPSRAASVSEHRYRSPLWKAGLSFWVGSTGRSVSRPVLASFSAVELHMTLSSSIHLTPCTCVTAADVIGSVRAVLLILKGKWPGGRTRGSGPYWPSLCLSPSLTYAADMPIVLASIRSGRSTIKPSMLFVVFGLAKR